jgi:hypothetical protein
LDNSKYIFEYFENKKNISNLENTQKKTKLLDTFFKLNKSAQELVMFRFQNIPAYVTIKKSEYIHMLNWIYERALVLEVYELCKKVMDVKKSL